VFTSKLESKTETIKKKGGQSEDRDLMCC